MEKFKILPEAIANPVYRYADEDMIYEMEGSQTSKSMLVISYSKLEVLMLYASGNSQDYAFVKVDDQYTFKIGIETLIPLIPHLNNGVYHGTVIPARYGNKRRLSFVLDCMVDDVTHSTPNVDTEYAPFNELDLQQGDAVKFKSYSLCYYIGKDENNKEIFISRKLRFGKGVGKIDTSSYNDVSLMLLDGTYYSNKTKPSSLWNLVTVDGTDYGRTDESYASVCFRATRNVKSQAYIESRGNIPVATCQRILDKIKSEGI